MEKIKKLNKFEKARLLGSRALEIANGDKPKVKTLTNKENLSKNYSKIAQEELDQGKLDLEIYSGK